MIVPSGLTRPSRVPSGAIFPSSRHSLWISEYFPSRYPIPYPKPHVQETHAVFRMSRLTLDHAVFESAHYLPPLCPKEWRVSLSLNYAGEEPCTLHLLAGLPTINSEFREYIESTMYLS